MESTNPIDLLDCWFHFNEILAVKYGQSSSYWLLGLYV